MKRILKKIIPYFLIRLFVDAKNKDKSTEEIFTEIYEKSHWGKAEDGRSYFSGSGTDNKNVIKYQNLINDFISKNNIKSIFEIGCGDFSIMDKVMIQHPQVSYIGADVVKSLINHLNFKPINENIKFIYLDAANFENYPISDLCIIRQVLQHLTNEQIIQILERTRKYRYTIITEHVPISPKIKNGNKNTNGYIRLQNKLTSGVYLDAEPFNLQTKELLSYRQDDVDYSGNIVPAVMLTTLIENPI